MGRIVAGVDDIGVGEIAAHLPVPDIVGPVVLVVTQGSVKRKLFTDTAGHRRAHAVFLRVPHVGINVRNAAVHARGIGVDQVRIIGHGESIQRRCPIIAQRHIQLDLAVIVIVFTA